MSSIDSTGASSIATALRDPPLAALLHIPGTEGWPLIGNTPVMLADPKGTVERLAARYGPVFRNRVFGRRTVTLLGPDANEFVLFDPGKAFSSALGWGPVFGKLFPRGLLLLDFEEHRLHRKALSAAFKAGALSSYLDGLNRGIAAGVQNWIARSPDLRFYPAIKRLTLDLAAISFLGAEMGPEAEAVKRAFIDMIAATVSFIRQPLPGTQMKRGIAGRQFLVDYFGRQIAARRNRDGADIFTQLCKATTEDGALLSPQDVIDQMSFLMMAAHDTLTSSLSSFVYFLAVNPDWQRRLRAEVLELGLTRGAPLPYERLDDLPLTEMAFKETLRLIPPVPSMPRCALRDIEFAGFHLPAGTRVVVNQLYTHRMSDLWPDPDRFDPLRFSEDRALGRHRYAFAAFGGGAHMCLGMHFGYMQAKCFIYHLLTRAEISLPPDYQPDWKYWPIPKPRDGLPVKLAPLHELQSA